MRPRAQSYKTLEALTTERREVPWYWKLVAVGSSFMILGGFLMLPASWEKEPDDDMRIKQDAVGIFAVALLTAGLSFTGLVCFAIRNPLFQRDSIFAPALTSCALGLLTIFYDFLIFTRYHFNTPALLTTIAAAVSMVVYAVLLVLCQRRITIAKTSPQQLSPNIPLQTHQHRGSEVTLGPESTSTYYDNYMQNMFPTAYTHAPPPPAPVEYVPQHITEEEMQRQQMLMLLLPQKEQPANTPDRSSSTFHIDWPGRDEEDAPPANGYYAPQSAHSQSPYSRPSLGIVRQSTNELQPWDGVWRTARVSRLARQRPSREEMERIRN